MSGNIPFPEKDRAGSPVAPTWDMRQRVAAALRWAAYCDHSGTMTETLPVEHCYGRFLHEPATQRAALEQRADWFLLALDNLGLVIEERGES